MQSSTAGSILRSTQAFCGQLCETESLEHGICFASDRFSHLPEANQFREVVIQDPACMAAAYEQAELWFAKRNSFCYRWAPAVDAPEDELGAFLGDRGFTAHDFRVMVLSKWVELDATPDVRVLPARAVRAVYRETFTQASWPASPQGRDRLADAYDERLDDPHLDMFVAVVDKQPAGRCALFQVGDIARVMGFFVLEPFSDGRVERALLLHVLTLARRLDMRRICTQTRRDDATRTAMLEDAGFVQDGVIVEFERSRPDEDNQP